MTVDILGILHGTFHTKNFPITLIVMLAKRSNSSAVSTGRKKPFLHHTFRCPHPDCNKSHISLLMDFTYTLVNFQNAPASGCPYKTDRHKQSCSHRHWNTWKHWLNTLRMMRNHLTSCTRLSTLSPHMTIAVLVHPTNKQVSILNLPMMQLWNLVSAYHQTLKYPVMPMSHTISTKR